MYIYIYIRLITTIHNNNWAFRFGKQYVEPPDPAKQSTHNKTKEAVLDK